MIDLQDSAAGETDRKKIWAGKAAVRAIYRELFRKGKNDQDWLMLIPQICLDGTTAEVLIDQIQMNGAPTGMNEKLYVSKLLVQLNLKLNSMDNLTKVGAMGYSEDQTDPYWWFADDFWLMGFKRDGICCGISGIMDSGKTHWCMILFEKWLKAGFNIVTNIEFTPPLEYMSKVVYTKCFSESMRALARPGRSILALDEVSQFFDRKLAMKQENIELEHFLRLVRKLQTSVIFIEQDPTRFPTLFEQFMTVYFFKPERKMVEYTIMQPEIRIVKTITEIPKTNLVWDTLHPSSYYIDIDMISFNDILVRKETFVKADIGGMIEELQKKPKGESSKSTAGQSDFKAAVDQSLELIGENWVPLLNSRANVDPMKVSYTCNCSKAVGTQIAFILNEKLPKADRLKALGKDPALPKPEKKAPKKKD